MKTRQRFLLGLGLGLALAGGASAADMGTAFTYQGLLEIDDVVVADETCDFLFKLYPELASGSQIGSTQTRNGVSVKDGLFIVTLDFASNNAFNGEARWLNIQVKCPPDGSFTELTPRQELTPTPYAIRAWEGVGPPNALEVDTTTGYVGIGTTSPNAKLEVTGTIHSTSGGFKFPDGTVQSSAALSASVGTGARNPLQIALLRCGMKPMNPA